jgi:hypothetical protein
VSAVARRLAGPLIAAVLLVGCTPATPAAQPAPTRSAAPASAAGGACHLLDYDVVGKILGTPFDVAAASQSGTTFTCVLRTRAASYPDLILAVTPTKLDAAAYRTSVLPKGATAVADLGKVGYSTLTSPGDLAGPGVEVGWLAGNGRLIVLRYRLATNAAAELAAAARPKVVALAMEIDISSL